MAINWYIRRPDTNPNESTNYDLAAGEPACSGADEVCAIQAEEQFLGGYSRPVIDEVLQTEIAHALNSQTSNGNVRLRD